MSKKILSCILCAALTASSLTVLAADVENGQPDVYVNDSKIVFSDQAAQIVNDRTLVPARGVFEAMGNRVEWNDETRTVKVTSSTGVTVATIVIDSAEMTVRTYKSLLVAEDVTVELDVPAQIMNDRTMIPLRAVSEAFNCEVEWDEENYCVNITTGEPARLEGAIIPTPTPDEEKVTMSLATDATNVAEGEEFDVYINIDNVPSEYVVSGLKIEINYDKTKLDYVADSLTVLDDNGNEIKDVLKDSNTSIENGISFVFVNIYGETFNTKGSKICKATFKKLIDEPVDLTINSSYVTDFGPVSYVQFTVDDVEDVIYSLQDLLINTAPLTIGE